jgi:hypothetical protein
MFLLVAGLFTYIILKQDQPPSLEARDPNSPTVVQVEPIVGIGEGAAGWNCTISGDGRNPTQDAGWPTGRVATDAQPTAMAWHSNPDWVEIVLSSGERLKLTWDKDAADRARASGEMHHFLNPKYEILPNPR